MLLWSGSGVGRRVALLADEHVEALLLEMQNVVAARGDRPTGPVTRQLEYDEQHYTHLVETLRAGSTPSAAVHVHPRTFRYRLRRLAEVGGFDVTDPEARFAAMLQLRVVAPPES
ncbi:helix-turn-helix domain-containing protein [Amycolatopsis sp., V23-08]|uniref:Helix-turn-helix domain-containing protein n=1 Tax=Amycolatopsis heterodermiae TaxID=3110235 RepID=A0ABU5RLV5_9PSEU|nr:helix-turn-helix domain-containing protein [Amycolatopsis sp., V23-08]MEA5367173.1 helix-turn-helix domain-containing protein [Amycolatopsis sp., V23-08]